MEKRSKEVVLTEITETETGAAVCSVHSAACVRSQRELARAIKLLVLCRSLFKDLQETAILGLEQGLVEDLMRELDRFLSVPAAPSEDTMDWTKAIQTLAAARVAATAKKDEWRITEYRLLLSLYELGDRSEVLFYQMAGAR